MKWIRDWEYCMFLFLKILIGVILKFKYLIRLLEFLEIKELL